MHIFIFIIVCAIIFTGTLSNRHYIRKLSMQNFYTPNFFSSPTKISKPVRPVYEEDKENMPVVQEKQFISQKHSHVDYFTLGQQEKLRKPAL